MDILILLTYTAICVAIFKIFKLPLNKWTVPTAVLGGVVLISSLIVVMNYNHPYSEISRSYFVTVPVVPQVSGQVTEVTDRVNEILEEGDILLKLDATPFIAKVTELKAELQQAEIDMKRANKLASSSALAIRDRDQAQLKVDELEPKLAEAQWELDNTIVRAPSRGFVTQVAVRPGIMATSIPLRPVMVFVPQEERVIVGWFRQNSILRLEKGNEAEIAFDSIPGKTFTAKLLRVLPAMAQGQVPAGGKLMNGASLVNRIPGRVAVMFYIDDESFEQYQSIVPGGAFGQVAVYSEHFRHLIILRRVLLRMSSWLNYIFPFH